MRLKPQTKTNLAIAFESSCDDTCVAISRGSSNSMRCREIKLSHSSLNRSFGGVYPHLTSSCHEVSFIKILKKFINVKTQKSSIGKIYYTAGPGQHQSLQKSMSIAKVASCILGAEIYGIHHMEGHIFSAANIPINKFPFLSVLISGGHTLLVLVESMENYTVLSKSLDDNIGEVYDKIARSLPIDLRGLAINGTIVEKLARSCNCGDISTFSIMKSDQTPDFSFSGLKTSILQAIIKSKHDSDQIIRIVCKFQRTIENVLKEKILQAIETLDKLGVHVEFISVGGGASSNSGIRKAIEHLAISKNLRAYFPEKTLATDNAIMILKAGARKERGSNSVFYPIPEFPLGFLKDDDYALDGYREI